jgi:pilus assembly protein Flp/PilA
MKLRIFIAHFAQEDSGATAIEYALIAAGIAVTILLSVQAVGSEVAILFGKIAAMFQ